MEQKNQDLEKMEFHENVGISLVNYLNIKYAKCFRFNIRITQLCIEIT